MDESYTSDELFHFVGFQHPEDNEKNYNILCSILKSQCITYDKNDTSWGPVRYQVNWSASLDSEELIVPTITCYADIPKTSLGIHMEKYGKFGIGLPRDMLIKYGTRPVTYFPMSASDTGSLNGKELLKKITAVSQSFRCVKLLQKEPERHSNSEVESILGYLPEIEKTFFKDFLAFIKPFNADLSLRHKDNFYMEREWRKLGNMKFSPQDIVSICVADNYIERFKKEFPQYAENLI